MVSDRKEIKEVDFTNPKFQSESVHYLIHKSESVDLHPGPHERKAKVSFMLRGVV